MKIASITDNDSVNSITGFTLSIFCQGCSHGCEGCQNRQTWNVNGGNEYSYLEIYELIKMSKCKNVSFSGGDIFHPIHRQEYINMIYSLKQNTNKFIYVWTGYKKEQVEKWIDLSLIDILIDGKFELDKRDLKLLLRGSSNQRLFFRGKEVNEKELLEIVDKL